MTELIWEGKYKDSSAPHPLNSKEAERGKKAAPVRIALPFQTIETVNAPRPLAQPLDLGR